MRNFVLFIGCICFTFSTWNVQGQQPEFIHVLNVKNTFGSITSLTVDGNGYVWFGCNVALGAGGLHCYNGSDVVSYMNDPKDSNSLADNSVQALYTDTSGKIWIGTWGAGLDRFDPESKTFTHYRHKDPGNASLSGDFVTAIIEGPPGKIWVGTSEGLNLLDVKTGKCTRYLHRKGAANGLSHNYIKVLYSGKNGSLWIGTYGGGLNLLNTANGTFTHYLHDPAKATSISNNFVTALYSDHQNRLWVGNLGSKLQTLDPQTGSFTHYEYDPAHPEKLSPPPPYNTFDNPLTVIREDASGALWIGAYACGINRYDPNAEKTTHYSRDVQNNQINITPGPVGDSLTTQASTSFSTPDGLFWLATSSGNLYYFNALKKNISYIPIKQQSANSFYQEPDGSLWIATDNGLVHQSTNGGQKIWVHDPANPNSIGIDGVNTIAPGENGQLWIGTNGAGLDLFNPGNQSFKHFRHNANDATSLSNDYLLFLYSDHQKNLWVATQGGLDKMRPGAEHFIHYKSYTDDSSSLSNQLVLNILEYQDHLWAGTLRGLNKLMNDGKSWKHYLTNSTIKSLLVDHTGTLWAGASDGLYSYNAGVNKFFRYVDPGSQDSIGGVLSVMEDNDKNLWVATSNSIYRINQQRNRLFEFGADYGVHTNNFLAVFGIKTKDGNLLLGDQGGYYTIEPELLSKQINFPQLLITEFSLHDKVVVPGKESPLSKPVSETEEIRLQYNQNSFSFRFHALHFKSQGEVHYFYQMKNYDDVWHEVGTHQEATFFRLPPGQFLFTVRAVNANNAWSEKSIAIIILPPWWKTWWAYSTYVILIAIAIWGFINYRSRNLKRKNRILELKVEHRTKALQQSLEELKATQKLLIQSEKMASLGELTTGIAHEIQNPLNFVNNFSDINRELLQEMQEEMEVGNNEEVKELMKDIVANEGKINHHGKRAGEIVKGMLQHSRTSSGKKELTDINALCDEYLRLSYHGLKAKSESEDQNFSIKLESGFDTSVGKINIVPQDIGRVLQNLFNNAFYACTERSRSAETERSTIEKKDDGQSTEAYSPVVKVSTRKLNDCIEIIVSDNGTGIPQKIVDKIFQPFFTTKPTGQGTGLGLSLSYDIIKAHGGELKVESISIEEAEQKGKENGGTTFTIQLPAV